MTTGHLITYANLTLLGNIYLGHLDNARGKLVADSDGELLALHLCIKNLELLQVVDNQLANELVGVLVVGPTAELYSCVVEGIENT